MGTSLEHIAAHVGILACCCDQSVVVSLRRSHFGRPAKEEFTHKTWLFGMVVTVKYVECESQIFLAGC